MKKYALVLAAGKGTRMRTELPKCAFPILRKPMISYIIENIEKSTIDEICVIVGHKQEVMRDILQDRVTYAFQEEQLGTGHAVLSAASELEGKEGTTFILPGDMPLMEYPVMNKIIRSHEEMGNDLTIVTMKLENPRNVKDIKALAEIAAQDVLFLHELFLPFLVASSLIKLPVRGTKSS